MTRLSGGSATPTAHTDNPDVEEDEELDVGALDASSELNHLASDLPDLDAGAWDEETSDIVLTKPVLTANVATMGAGNSHEEISAAVRATAEQLSRNNEAQQTAPRQSTGRLKRPSNVGANPAYKNPLASSTTSAQRKLAPTNNIRKSVFEFGDDSPEKRPPSRAVQQMKADFSPTKAQRKKAQELEDKQLLEESPRRSTRRQVVVEKAQQEQEDEELLEDTPRRSEREHGFVGEPQSNQTYAEETAKEDHVENVAANDDAENEMYRDFVPAHVVRQYREELEEAAVGAAEDEDQGRNDDVEIDQLEQVVEDIEDEEERVQPKKRGRPKKTGQNSTELTPQKRKSGRPKKAVAQPNHSDAVELDEAASIQVSPQKRKPGRPKKSDVQPTQGGLAPSLAVENLRKRRSQNVEGGEANGEKVLVLERAAQDDTQKQPRDVTKVFQPKKSASRLQREEEKEGRREANKSSTATKKRKQRDSVQANTPKKRRKSEDGFLAEDAAITEGNQRRLCGQWLPLREIYKNLDKIGCNVVEKEIQEQNDVDLDDTDVVALAKLCKEAKKRYSHLKDHGGTVDADENPASVLEEIKDRIEGLRGRNDDYPTNFGDKWKCTQIYFHLIPRLVRLVGHAVFCYEAMDQSETTNGQVKFGHLRTLREMVGLIIRLEESAKKKYTARPDSALNVVRPTHNGVIVPLCEVANAFSRHIRNHEAEVQERRDREREAQDRAVRLEQEERQSRQNARISALRKKWERLHYARYWAETGIPTREKLEHLRFPNNDFETDQNGMLFERTEVFIPRVGPPPGLVAEAEGVAWTMVESAALCEGLKKYAGPDVYEWIFKEFCERGRELNRFNLTEIVTAAANMRELLVNDQTAKYGDVEDWITAIPVWTKGHHASGQENDTQGEIEGDGERPENVEDLIVET